MSGRTRFINVDLDVFSDATLAPLARAMEAAGAVVLHSGRWHPTGFHASFEISDTARTSDRTIRALVELVQALPARPRALFQRAKRRVFSIGINADDRPHAFTTTIKPATVRLLAELDAELEIVVYVPDRDEPAEVVAGRGGARDVLPRRK